MLLFHDMVQVWMLIQLDAVSYFGFSMENKLGQMPKHLLQLNVCLSNDHFERDVDTVRVNPHA